MSRESARRAVRIAIDDVGAPGGRTGWAKAAGIDPKTLRTFLNGGRWPIPHTLRDIETALGWPRGRIEDLAAALEPHGATVPDAIRADAALLPEVREHLLDTYHLLLRLQAMPARKRTAQEEADKLDRQLGAEVAEHQADRSSINGS